MVHLEEMLIKQTNFDLQLKLINYFDVANVHIERKRFDF